MWSNKCVGVSIHAGNNNLVQPTCPPCRLWTAGDLTLVFINRQSSNFRSVIASCWGSAFLRLYFQGFYVKRWWYCQAVGLMFIDWGQDEGVSPNVMVRLQRRCEAQQRPLYWETYRPAVAYPPRRGYRIFWRGGWRPGGTAKGGGGGVCDRPCRRKITIWTQQNFSYNLRGGVIYPVTTSLDPPLPPHCKAWQRARRITDVAELSRL